MPESRFTERTDRRHPEGAGGREANLGMSSMMAHIHRGGLALPLFLPATLGALQGLPSNSVTVFEEAILAANDGEEDDQFGDTVAVSADLALVGAFRDDDNGGDSGSAYIFVRNGTNWNEQAKLLPSDGAASDNFGFRVSLAGDTAVLTAPGDDDNGTDSGSAYIFVRNGTAWSEQAKLLASDGAAGDRFGSSVSVNNDTAVVGARGDDDNGDGSGSAYVFVRTGTTWNQQEKLLPSDGAANDSFGVVSVSIDTVVVGAPSDDDNGSNSGSAYVFVRTGTAWSEQAKLLPSDGAPEDVFGLSVSASKDTIIGGAIGDDDNGDLSGSAYVFTRVGTAWSQETKLLPSGGVSGDGFGVSVSVSDDTAAIGAFQDLLFPLGNGKAYIFERTQVTWNEQATLLASNGKFRDSFGYSVAVDGRLVIVGAWRAQGLVYESGLAYAYELPPLDARATVALAFPIESRLESVLDRQRPARDEEEVAKLGWRGDVAKGPHEPGELARVDVAVGRIADRGPHQRGAKGFGPHLGVVVADRQRGEIGIAVEKTLPVQRIDHVGALRSLEVDHQVEAVHENVLAQDREDLVGGRGDIRTILRGRCVAHPCSVAARPRQCKPLGAPREEDPPAGWNNRRMSEPVSRLADGSAPATPEQLFELLDALGIVHGTVEHEPVFTVEEAKAVRARMPGGHTKNLFLRNKKGRMWLVVCQEDRLVDLKALARHVGAGRFSFGSADRLMRHLGVIPGAVSPFAIINDRGGLVSVVLDLAVLDDERINFHPLDNARTTRDRERRSDHIPARGEPRSRDHRFRQAGACRRRLRGPAPAASRRAGGGETESRRGGRRSRRRAPRRSGSCERTNSRPGTPRSRAPAAPGPPSSLPP